MSKQKRSGKPFRTLGQRMLSFGRTVMRTYSNEVSIQPETSSEPTRPQGQWRSMSDNRLIWREEQTTPAPPAQPSAPQDAGYDEAFYMEESDYQPFGNPIQRRPQQQPQQQRPVQRQAQRPPQQQSQKPKPNYVQMNDGTPVQVSKKTFESPLQRRLESIMAAHAEANAERDKEREQKIESLQRKVESGELSTRRRRGSIDVDYVSTDSLLTPEDREKIQAERQAQADSDTAVANADNTDDDNAWFDEVPDDDADIDNIAGFESSDDDIQRLPDDLPRFDPSSLEGGDDDDNMGEFEGGYETNSPVATDNNIIDRAYDDDYPVQEFDNGDSFFDAPAPADTPIQRTADDLNSLPTFDDFEQDETVPLIPNMDTSPAPTTDTPVQRTADDMPVLDEESDSPFSDTSTDNPPPISDTPVQRQIQRTEADTPAETNYPAQDFDDSFNAVDTTPPQVDVPTVNNDTPVQRQIQRTPLDTPDGQLGDGGDYDDFGDQTWAEANNISSDTLPQITPTSDAPVQRQAFDEYGDEDMDFIGGDVPDVNALSDTPTDTPVQRQAFDEYGDEDMDVIGGDVPDVNTFSDTPAPAPSSDDNTPIQRTELDDSDVDFGDMPSVDAPIQRTAFDEPQFDEYGDYSAFADDTPSVDAPTRNDTPVQRRPSNEPQFDEYGDYGQDDYTDYNDTGDMPTLNTTPADNTPIQRQVDDVDMGTADVPSADTLEVNPGESLSIQAPKVEQPKSDRPIQRTPSDDTPSEPTSDPAPQVTPTSEPTVQRREIDRDHPDLGDGGEYDDFGDQTWAEANNISSDTLPQITPTGDAPVQRQAFDESQVDDYSNDMTDVISGDVPDVNAFSDTPADAPVQRQAFDEYGDDDMDVISGDVPDVNAFSDTPADAPVQRQAFDEYGDDDMDVISGDVPDVNAFSDTPADAPVQRQELDAPNESLSISRPTENTPTQRPIQRRESEPVADDYDDYGDQTWAEANDYSPATNANNAPVQHQELDNTAPSESLSINRTADSTPAQQPVQRQELDNTAPSESLSINRTADSTPAQQPVQRQAFDEYGDEDMDFISGDVPDVNAFSDTPADAPVQRRELDAPNESLSIQPPADDYDDYGDQTWAEANDYSPATDAGTDTPIQREVDDRNTLPTFDDFDGVEDTDGMTAMNILSDYLSEQNQADSPASPDNTPVQRTEQDYDYLPEGFDPTPEIYNFDAVNNAPTADAPIQRTPQNDSFDDSPNAQPMDLFSALSQAGAVTSNRGNNTPVQRDMQDADDYEDYGDQTWAEMHNYSPASDNANEVQRSTDESFSEQPMDLFSALAQEGAVTRSGNGSDNIQRTSQNGGDESGVDPSMADLYNAMMESGMIQQSNPTSYTSSEPIQREAQPEPQAVDLSEALRRATQVSESSAHNSSETSQLGGDVRTRQIQRDTDSGTGPSSGSETSSGSASTDGDDTDGKVTVEDKRYLDQLARDVFRVIKRRLREEKERRG